MVIKWVPCANAQCEEGMVHMRHGDGSDSWSTCPECEGMEGYARDVDDDEEPEQ
ncbi:hypothetical protein JXVLWARM_CDS_0071 [Burkholderia phage Bm1]